MSPYAFAVPPRGADEAAAIDRIDDTIRQIADSLGAQEMRYPALIARSVLEDAEYPRAFPHLLMSATCLDMPHGDDSVHESRLHEPLTGKEWCLSPAVCYHAYAQLAGRTLARPIVMSARGRCFRAEQNPMTGLRQIEFDMREIVLAGDKAWIDETVHATQYAIEAAARALELAGDWEVAEDPFFLPAASGKALMQRLLKVKLEYQWPAAGGLALASINRHGTFFGERFRISGAGDRPIHTACIAVGLDRWAHLGHAREAIDVTPLSAYQETQS